MAKNSKKKKKKKTAAPGTADKGGEPTAAPLAGASLGIRPSARRKVEKPSRKQEAALAKKAARAKLDERMTAEGR